MKKIFFLAFVVVGALVANSCVKDPIQYSDVPEREFMTMFRCDHNTGKGDADPYNCKVEALNDVHLYWYGVNDCAGYEVKWGLLPNVSSGKEGWEKQDPETGEFTSIIGSVVLPPDVTDYVVKDLQYCTDYRFAIRTLSKKGEGYHSKWYGYGNGRQWADWIGFTTEIRYNVPEVIVANNVQKNSLRINFDMSVSSAGGAASFPELDEFGMISDGTFLANYLTVEPSPTNPKAIVPVEFQKYTLTAADFERGYVEITGLTENSVYVINVVNEEMDKACHWDAIFNTCVIRTDGTPGEPIFVKHEFDPNFSFHDGAEKYQAMMLDSLIVNYTSDASLAEGTIFELEGGKTYYFYGTTDLCKGFVLRTRPEDLAAGKKRARVLLSGMGRPTIPNPETGKIEYGSGVQAMNFMFGRQPRAGELGGINVKSVIFEDLDFDAPEVPYYNRNTTTSGQGNYFANMHSNGMAVTFQSFEARRCSFQHQVRGFIRVQGANRKVFEKIVIEDCLIYNGGAYDNNGRGYAWFAGDGKQPKSNIYTNLIMRNNTIYDTPRTCMFNDNGKSLSWPSTVKYKITFENNTLVNFSTRSPGRKIFDLRYLPGGSQITIKNNLFVQTRAADDTARDLPFEGMDIRTINGDGGLVFDIKDNYSTSMKKDGTLITSGEIFSAGAFSAKSNSAGKWPQYCINGAEELVVKLGSTPLAPTDLFNNPNPRAKFGVDDYEHYIKTADLLSGMQFKPSASGHEIVTKNIGDPHWPHAGGAYEYAPVLNHNY